MCGLTGILALTGGPAPAGAIEAMTDALIHRGPDDDGCFTEGAVALGFRRLAILDLSPAGHQPMISPDGRFVIVYNGEIYNYLELREELRALGHSFRSTGDTEVLLAAYRQWGPDCLERLNGMWAFLIYDRRDRRLFGARDRFGVKPLYVHRGRHCLLFASEIKGILASGLLPEVAVNWQVAARFLLHGQLDEAPRQTFYRHIEQLPPGTAFEVSAEGHYRDWSYWSLDGIEERPDPEAPERFFALFEDAVRLRLRSDVPVGVCLSGGLDSTAIICSMARQREAAGDDADDPLHTFSFIDRDFDESAYIADTLAQTKAVSHRLGVTPLEMWDRTVEALRFHDEPYHSSSAIMGFELMRLAKAGGVKVVLNGQGADEAIAGYPNYFWHLWDSLLSSGRLGTLWQALSAYTAAHGGRPSEIFSSVARRALGRSLRAIPLYREAARRRFRERLDETSWVSPQVAEACTHDPDEPERVSLGRSLIDSVEGNWLRLYLRVEDRNSMAHSLEARLPFLDYRLVSYVCSLPDEWKIRGPWNKVILREAMKGRMPESVRSRVDKFGFPVPIERWFRTDLHEPFQDLIADRRTRERGLYDIEAIERGIMRQKHERADIGSAFYRFVQFEHWMRLLDERPWSKPVARAGGEPPLAAVSSAGRP